MARSRNAEVLRKLRAIAVANGMCQECRTRPAKPGCATCQVCLDRRKAVKEANVAHGRCACGYKPRPELTTCERCGERQRARGAEDYALLARARICTHCRAIPALAARTMCQGCLDQMSALRAAGRAADGAIVGAKRCTICGERGHSRQRHTRDGETR